MTKDMKVIDQGIWIPQPMTKDGATENEGVISDDEGKSQKGCFIFSQYNALRQYIKCDIYFNDDILQFNAKSTSSKESKYIIPDDFSKLIFLNVIYR